MFSDIDKAFCVEAYISTKSFAHARRLLVKKLGWDHRKTSRAPSNATINSWVAKFRDGRLCRRRPGSGRPRSLRSEAMVKKVAESVQKSPERSLRHRAQSLGLKKSSLNSILKKDLNLRPYRIQIRHKLSPEDQRRRLKMANWLTDHPSVFDRVWFSDETHFWLDGKVNSHKAVHWGSKSPDKVLEKPLHSEKVTVWMAMKRGGGLIGPFFFEDECGVAATINADRCQRTALQPFWRELQRKDGVDPDEEWMQQDGGAPHTAGASMAWLAAHFPGRLISLKSEVEWAPHSPDLSPLDFFLWGYLKDRVYRDKPRTTEALKDAIVSEVGSVPLEMVDRAVNHLQTTRLPAVIRQKGGHIEHRM